MENTKEQHLVANIDEHYKNKLDYIKERHKEDYNHYINRLELKHIYIFAILMSLKNGSKPQNSHKKHWIIRRETLKEDDLSILRSLIFCYKNDIKILLPENGNEFYELCERLANAGMGNVIELLEHSEDVERKVLLESKKFMKDNG